MKTLSAALSSLLLLGSRVQNVDGCASNAECVCNAGNRCAESIDESIVAFPDEQCKADRDEQCICNTNGECELLCMDFETSSAAYIVEDVLRDPNGFIEVRNITSSAHACFESFTNGHVMGNLNPTTPLIPDEGVIMGTGKPRDFCYDDSRVTNTAFDTPGDADLETLPGINAGETADACFLEFEFRCTGEFPQVSFNYLWGSDEYIENRNDNRNDAFAFFLNGDNIAFLPDGMTPVTIDNVNPSRNSQYYINNREEDLYPIIEADGFTTMLNATGTVNDNGWGTMKIVIADVNEAEVDSYVLLEAGSLSCLDPSASFTPSAGSSLAPSVSSAPSVSQKPSLSSKPSASASPSVSSKPSVSTAPSTSQEPSASAQPSASAAPSVSANPSTSAAPSVSLRPSASAQPSVTANPSVTGWPTVSAHPSVSAAPSASAAPSTSSAPSVTGWPTVSAHPSVSSNPSVSAAPSTSAAPSVSAQPSVSAAPSVSSNPSVTGRPTVSSEPSVSTAPSVSANPSASVAPSVTGWPTVSTKPSISTNPSASAAPSTSAAPSVTGWPTASNKPSVSTNPSVSSAPSVSANPSVTGWPTLSSKPSISTNPSVSAAPSVSANPSVTGWPTVSAQPSISANPSASVAPSVTGWPTVSAKPSVSTNPSVTAAPSTSAAPSESAQPSVSTAPSVSANPSVTGRPTVSSKPSVSAAPSISTNPSASVAPSISQNPTVSTQPSVSSNPSMSAAPSVSHEPTLSTQPSVSTNPSMSSSPSISQNPTVSTQPSVSAKPSISAAPSVSHAPSVSAQPSASAAPSVSSNPSVTSSPSISHDPTVSTQPSVSANPSMSAAPSDVPTTSSAPSPQIPGSISGIIFSDLNQDGVRDPNENGLPNIVIGLWCERNGQPPAMVDTDTTDSNGDYMFSVDPPGRCFIRVETDGYIYGPRVSGGNQLGPDGRSPEVDVDIRDAFVINGGLYLPFEVTCVEHCNDVIEDCGWGLWNPCTCQCDCDPGFCLSSNQKCYDGCLTFLDFNPFGGCRPGTDCPWYPDNLGAAHCTSSQNFAGIYNLHETAEKCCDKHFGTQNVNTCAQNSVADVEAQEQLTQDRLDRPRFYWPDLHGKRNCVFDSGYDVFMETLREQYLFDTEEGCCGLWYPLKSDCPEVASLTDVASATTPFQLDYNPDVSLQFYYPNLSESNCRFGRNYPIWMKNSPRHYLYTTPEECCSVWYQDGPSCVQAEDDGVQEGFYWIVDEAFYPNFNGDWCAQGNSYPEWMSDVTERNTHLFMTGQECCDLWFPDKTAKCQSNIVTVIDGHQIAGPDVTGTWYPSLNGIFQCINGTPPSWMTASEGYEEAYVFDSRSECCKAHWCQAQRNQIPPF